MSNKWKDLGTLLVEYRLLTEADIQEGAALQKKTGDRLGEALVKLGKVTMEDIDWVLSKQLDIPFVIVEDVTPDNELIWRFPREFLVENRILPLFETDELISIATEDPFNESALDFIREKYGKQVQVSTGSGSKIEDILKNTFKKTIFPELVETIEGVVEKIKETSFYRIDFLLGESSCSIHVFGSGILKYMQTLNGQFARGDVFRAFDHLKMRFLYAQSDIPGRCFLAVYPLMNRIEIEHFPAITGKFGLFLPDDIMFSGMHSHGLTQFFYHKEPVKGYKYFSVAGAGRSPGSSIFVPDSAPEEFEACYVNIYVPRQCSACDGRGCDACKDLGYEFKEVEGTFSSDELKKIIKED